MSAAYFPLPNFRHTARHPATPADGCRRPVWSVVRTSLHTGRLRTASACTEVASAALAPFCWVRIPRYAASQGRTCDRDGRAPDNVRAWFRKIGAIFQLPITVRMGKLGYRAVYRVGADPTAALKSLRCFSDRSTFMLTASIILDMKRISCEMKPLGVRKHGENRDDVSRFVAEARQHVNQRAGDIGFVPRYIRGDLAPHVHLNILDRSRRIVVCAVFRNAVEDQQPARLTSRLPYGFFGATWQRCPAPVVATPVNSDIG